MPEGDWFCPRCAAADEEDEDGDGAGGPADPTALRALRGTQLEVGPGRC